MFCSLKLFSLLWGPALALRSGPAACRQKYLGEGRAVQGGLVGEFVVCVWGARRTQPMGWVSIG